MDLRLLPSFVVLAEEANFTRAAARLQIAQPALSQQLQRLERQLGATLVRRTRQQHFSLTDAGLAFLRHARLAIDHAEAAVAAVHASRVDLPERIRLGVFGSGLGPAILPALNRLRHVAPRLEVKLVTYDFSRQVRAILDRQVDAGLVVSPLPADAALVVTPILTTPRAAVVPAGHRLADKSSILWDDLAGETFLPVAAHLDMPAYRDYWLGRDTFPDADQRVGPELEGLEDALVMIAEGRGISVAPLGPWDLLEHRSRRAVPIDDLPHATWAITARRDNPYPAAIDLLTRTLTTTLAENTA